MQRPVFIPACFLLLDLMLAHTDVALAQGAASTGPPTNACDLAAASTYDKQRPADVPGVLDHTNPPNASYGTLTTSVAIPACEAAVRAAPQDPRMLYQLARSYREEKRFSDAIPLYRQAAQMGNALAAYDLSVIYAYGTGVAVDLKAQIYYLDQASQAGLSIAQNDLGVLLISGNAALPKDANVGRQFIMAAAQDGTNAAAMNNMAFVLEEGIGGPKDDVEARHWYEKSANVGNFKAMNTLGFRLLQGRGGKKDLVEARQWFQKAADGNNPLGIRNLGMMFENGLGGAKDLDEARRLYQKAIDLGENQFAAKNLANLQNTGGTRTVGPGSDPH